MWGLPSGTRLTAFQADKRKLLGLLPISRLLVAPAPQVLERLATRAWCQVEDEVDNAPEWTPVRFDAGTAKDEHGLAEREILTYCGAWQVRWNVKRALEAWERLEADPTYRHQPLYGTATAVGGPVSLHVTVKDDLDVVALEGEIVKSLRF